MTITLPTQSQLRQTLKSDLPFYLYAKHVIETVCLLDGHPLTFDTKTQLLSFFKGDTVQKLEDYYDRDVQIQFSQTLN